MTNSFSTVVDVPVINATVGRNNGAAISFTQTATGFSPAVSNYEYSTDSGTSWIARFPASYLSPLIITGLTNNISYAIQIRAINSIGTSCPSLSASVTPAMGSVPDAPTNLVVTPINSGGMIQFTAPTNDGGSSITNYEYSTDGGSNWITPSPAITTSPLIISSGLTNCTSYQLQLRAVNISGSGAASLAATLVPSTSTDIGVNWNQRIPAADNSWNSITYGNGLFVAVSSTGVGNRVMTSLDGITWTPGTSVADNSWQSVTYGIGLFVAVSSTGTSNRVMTSADGIIWTARTSATDNGWQSVTYGNGLFVAVAAAGTGNRVMTSPDGIIWTIRTHAANNSWSSVTYGNGLFVAVSSTGVGNRVMTSPDGIIWTARTSAANNSWVSVTYGNGLFVAVSNTGTGNLVMTSPDGITWTISTSVAINTWRSVTYGNGLFVAVAQSGTGNRVMTSPDGITWTSRTSAADNAWNSVTYGNGLFVAVSGSGVRNRVMTSGFSPTADVPVISNISPRNNAASVAFTQTASANAPAVSNYEYSTDNGSTWTARNPASNLSPMIITGLTNATTYNIKIRAINSVGTSCTSNMMSVTPALGTVADAPTNLVANPIINSGGVIQFNTPTNDGGSDITNYEYSTDNGTTWVTPSPAVSESPLSIIGLSNCTLYAIKLRAINASGAGAASVMTSLTPIVVIAGFKWTTKTSAADNDWRSVTYGNGLFVAVARSGNFNRVMTSPDGTSWTVRNTPVNNNYESVTYGNGLFVAVAITGTGNRVMTSPDGITWTARTSAADNLWYGVTYANNLFVAVAADGVGNRVMTSPDGITWTSRASAVDNQWTSVTFGNGLFVAVANSGTGNRVMTSPDGITWTSRTSATDNSWYSVTFGNGIFVAVSYDGSNNRVMTSSDGINWTERTSASDNSWNRVTYGNGLFVAVAQSGTSNRVMTSTDGIAWTSRTTTAENNWYDITYGNGLFVAVAWSGTGNRVMTSSNAVVADAPVISSVLGNQIEASLSFTQTTPALAPAIINYQYSIDNGASWTVLSPAATTSPITITGLTDFTNQIQLQAINSVGNSCAAIYSVAFNLNKFGQKTSTGSDFVNKNGALGISGIRATGESRTFFPVLSATAAVIDITTTTATSGGTVGADRGAAVTARGVCWSLTANPTTANSKTIDGNGIGTFTSAISGLESNTTYYVRSYATNSVGTTYGPEVSFTTL